MKDATIRQYDYMKTQWTDKIFDYGKQDTNNMFLIKDESVNQYFSNTKLLRQYF